MNKTKEMTLLFTILFSGLVAGLLFGFSCAVNLGLGKLGDSAYISAMQSINTEIQNFIFLLVFMGLLPLLIIATIGSFPAPEKARFYLLLTATLVYCIGVIGVTAVGNIPLNNQLAHIQPATMTNDAMSAFRINFETKWVRYHTVRTAGAILSFLLTILAAFKK